MNCPTIDKLSQYVDNLVDEQEFSIIHSHVKSCQGCKRVIEAFEMEQQFIQDTLKTPVLPDEFDQLVLEQLQPYTSKKKSPFFKKWMGVAAGIVVAFSLTATFNTSFAKWIGGLFSTDQVDEGLRVASDAGFAVRVNKEVTDQGLTLKVEDIVADTSRIAFSYQVLGKDGDPQDTHIDLRNTSNKIYAVDENGDKLDISSMSWTGRSGLEYGLISFSIDDQQGLEQLTIKLELEELKNVAGNWKLDIPVDLRESIKSTKVFALDGKNHSANGVTVKMNEVRFAPSANEIVYETSFTDEEQAKVEKRIKDLEDVFGKEVINTFLNFSTSIQFHLEDKDGKPFTYNNVFLDGKGHPIDIGLIESNGWGLDELGKIEWRESFVPQINNDMTTFVLDGVIKTVPTDFSITFQPKKLKNNPVSFEYEGNFITIKEAAMDSDFSIIPFKKEKHFKIEMTGGREQKASELGEWALVDDKGNVYSTHRDATILDEKDDNDRYKTTIELSVEGMEEVPEQLTLYLLSITRYEQLEKEWKVSLY